MKGCDCEESRNTGMMEEWVWCPYCGCELEEEEAVDEAVFCGVCGGLLKNGSKCSWCNHENELYGKSPLATATEQLSLLELSKRVNNSPISDIADALSKKSEMFKALEENPAWNEHLNAIDAMRDDVADSMRIPLHDLPEPTAYGGLAVKDLNGAATWEVQWDDTVESIIPENKNWRKIL